MTVGLILPALGLGLLGWLMPKLWSMVLPEGIPALFANAILSALALTALTGLFFVISYWSAGVTLGRLADQGITGNIAHFGRLGSSAAIIWAPMMCIALMGLPRTWTRATW
ncbi:hypothetical protein ACOI1H_12560 [Loktanella sp. DJP18]|uniref:hypothetical protein n=1 Tax=Loktanella sp. DJP18 TaxID=3409788 RepID=UPI003BB4C7A7